MTENTKNKKAPGKKPKTTSRTSAKAREKKMREERMKGTLLFGLKLVIVLALVAGAVHALSLIHILSFKNFLTAVVNTRKLSTSIFTFRTPVFTALAMLSSQQLRR